MRHDWVAKQWGQNDFRTESRQNKVSLDTWNDLSILPPSFCLVRQQVDPRCFPRSGERRYINVTSSLL